MSIRIFQLAAACAFLALVFTAVDQLSVAGGALLSAGVVALAGLLLSLFRHLPEDAQRVVLSGRSVAPRLAFAVVLATVLSCAYWFVGFLPIGGIAQLLHPVWRSLDLPPAAFSLLLPAGWRSGLHQHFQQGTYCFPGPFWWESVRYLRAAIPAYTLVLFGFVTLARLLGAAVKARRP